MAKAPPKDKSRLRTGFTTGACAAAAARAACEFMLSGTAPDHVRTLLPNGKRVAFAVERAARTPDGGAVCAVIKDAGDDPDCTHGAHMTATVAPAKQSGIHLHGGDGVGTITRAGLGLPVGSPAINPVPRQNITANVEEVLPKNHGGVEVTISVPGGQEMATHTLNARLGIEGGISILGTTGIVRPYSTSAFKASVEQAISTAAAEKVPHIVLTTGGRSEKYAIALLPDLPEAAFIQMGDFVGFALKSAADCGVQRVTLCGMIGKLSKLADGKRQTHAKGSEVNMAMLAMLAKKIGAAPDVVAQVKAANTGRHAMEIAEEAGVTGLAAAVCERAAKHAAKFADGKLTVEVIMTDFDGNVQGRYPAG